MPRSPILALGLFAGSLLVPLAVCTATPRRKRNSL